jgi:hypothetical protein
MTYAKAAKAWRAAGAGKGGAKERGTRPKEMAIPARRQREVVIKPRKEITEQKNKNKKELIEQIQREGAKEVVAIRRLLSGDIMIIIIYKEAKKDI